MKEVERMSITYKVVEQIFFLLGHTADDVIKKQMYRKFFEAKDMRELPRYMYRKLEVNKVDCKGFPVYILQNKKKEKRTEKAILFLAGGGGLLRPMGIHFDTVTRLVKKSGATVYFAYYPLAPKHNVRNALAWLQGVYFAIQKRYEAKDIVFVGDSAGANLALSLANIEKGKPRKIIAISPAPGLENGLNREIRKAMEAKDPILNVAMNDLIAKFWAKDVPLDNPDVNPASIDYSDFSEVMLLYGTHEVFYPHVAKLVEKMKKDGANITCIEKDMCHDWALCSFFPEGREALKKMVEYIK